MENSNNTPEEENYILKKINLEFRKAKLAPDLKQEYTNQALKHYHEYGNISKFEFVPPQKDTKNQNNQNYTVQKDDKSPSQHTNKKELTSFQVQFDKEGNAIAKDNKGNTLPPAPPEEVFKKIVQKFKASGAKQLNIKAPNGKKDDRITGIFAKECIMSGIAPAGDLPKSTSFWTRLKKEFLSANHTLKEWQRLTSHIPEANTDDKDNDKQDSLTPKRKKRFENSQKESMPQAKDMALAKKESNTLEQNSSLSQPKGMNLPIQMLQKQKRNR